MKKLLFLLTFLTAMLLFGGAAMAGNSCRSCGSSDLTMVGSGSWCRWDCNQCGYQTALNHNPNSKNSGLSPNSCSGRCTWCGASAIWSSHTFTNWVLNSDVTCTTDGSETAKCSNAQCSASTTRHAPGSAYGHNYVDTVHRPTCENIGYVNHTCSRCGDSKNDQVKGALGHAYGPWTSNGDGTHTQGCTRAGCRLGETAPCTTVTTLVGGAELTLCEVCGYVVSGNASAALPSSSSASATTADGSSLPGELVVTVDAAPLDMPLKTDAFYMFITTFLQDGQAVEITGTMNITIDLNNHPFYIPDSIFFDRAPSELNPRALKIVRVEQTQVDGKNVEVWHEMPFTLDEGILTFETDRMGVFLMVFNIVEAPSAS